MRFVKPLDLELLTEACGLVGRLVTVEDNAMAGGFGSAVLEAANAAGLKAQILRLGIPYNYIEQGKPDELYAELGLDANGIDAAITGWLSRLKAACAGNE